MAKFTKILPLHFKTSNFNSFLRQLHMYSFHKVRDQKYRYEFRHPFFKKDNFDDLKYIRRKCVKSLKKKDLRQKTQKNNLSNNRNLYGQVVEMEKILEMTVKQNTVLVGINKQMVDEMKSIEVNFKSRVNNLMGLMVENVRNPESNLSINFRNHKTDLQKERPNLDTIASWYAYFHSYTFENHCVNQNLDLMSVIDKVNTFYENFKAQYLVPSVGNDIAIDRLENDVEILKEDYSFNLYSIPSPVNNYGQVSKSKAHFYLLNDKKYINSPLELNNILLSPTDNPLSHRVNNELVYVPSELFFADTYESDYCFSDYDEFVIHKID